MHLENLSYQYNIKADLSRTKKNADTSNWSRIGKNDGLCERGNEPDSDDNKLCST